MAALLLAVVLIPIADQAIKRVVRRRLGPGSLALGVFGELRVVQSEVWTLRMRPRLSLHAMWVVWTLSTGAALVVAILVPASSWAIGLLVSAALSHAIETSVCGSICDYVCLRFWPAFNLADVALTVGALGVVYELLHAAA